MPLRSQLFDAYHAVATGSLRFAPAAADAFASDLADAHAGLHVIGMLCTAPNGLAAETVAAMLDRWFGLLGRYDGPAVTLRARRAAPAVFPRMSGLAAVMFDARVFEVCVTERGMSVAHARETARWLCRAASAFLALDQRCRAQAMPSRRVLCGTLQAALGDPLDDARRAARYWLTSAERARAMDDSGLRRDET